MESANLHDHHQQQQQHQLQEQFVGCSFAAESSHGGSIPPHHLRPSTTWNTENCNIILNEIHPNSKGLCTKRDSSISPISKTSLIQDFGLCDQQFVHDDDQRESHWLSSFSSADHQLHSNAQISPARFGGIALSNNSYNFCHVFPSTNISNQDSPLSLGSSSLGMSFQALDPLTSRDGGKRFSLQSLNGNFGFMKEEESSVSPSSSSNKASATRNEATRVKRLGCFSETKAYSQEPAKKPRNVAKLSSAAPFKVRKEKLGDKIAALHRLVAPFGKTDTASVLTEVIGYIQFLQFQIQTLSRGYMKSTPTKPFTTIISQGSSMEIEKGEMKQDLRSRGLCLVPISFVSYISSSYNNVGGDVDLTSR